MTREPGPWEESAYQANLKPDLDKFQPPMCCEPRNKKPALAYGFFSCATVFGKRASANRGINGHPRGCMRGRKDFRVLPVIGSQAGILLLPDTHVYTSPVK
jgi:hypothetical protein